MLPTEGKNRSAKRRKQMNMNETMNSGRMMLKLRITNFKEQQTHQWKQKQRTTKTRQQALKIRVGKTVAAEETARK
jgi:hypothetical protein